MVRLGGGASSSLGEDRRCFFRAGFEAAWTGELEWISMTESGGPL